MTANGQPMVSGEQTDGTRREIYRRRVLDARNAFIYGSETLEELAARFQVVKGDLTRMSRKEGWPTLRKNKREDMARQLEARASVSLITRRLSFLGDAARMITTLGELIEKEMDRIKDGMPNATGQLPTFLDTQAVAKSLLTFVQAGKIAYAIPDELRVPERRQGGTIIDVEPVGAADPADPFAIQAPGAPNSPLELRPNG